VLLATFEDRPDLAERTVEIPTVWPEFMLYDDVVGSYWSRLREELPHLQLVLYDEERDVVVGEGRTVSFRWDGLPGGLDDVLVHAFADDGRPRRSRRVSRSWRQIVAVKASAVVSLRACAGSPPVMGSRGSSRPCVQP
jgi:hypothetical protein